MQVLSSAILHDFQWLLDLGVRQADLGDLNPCVPGEFTMPAAYYVNSGSPGIVYRGTEEGTLPLVAGRWYLIPTTVTDRNAPLSGDAVPVARAPRLMAE